MAWAAVLAAPEATELGCLDGITWHGELEEMPAREDCCREGRSEAEDLPSPFEDLFVHGLQLMGRRWDELAGIREPRNECTLEDVDFAVDGSWSVSYGMKVPVKLELVMFKLRLPLWIQVILTT